MDRRNKVFEPKSQKETTEQLRELFDKHIPSSNKQVASNELELGGYGSRGVADPWENLDDPLTQMLRDGARILISTAVQCELEEFLMNFTDRKLQDGRAAVVRNGYLPQREIQTSIGPVKVRIPKVRSRDQSAVTFQSALVPPYVRKSASLEAALPWLYLKGLSTGEMGPALEVLVGPEAKGLSPSTVSRLKSKWTQQHDVWRNKDLGGDKWVYLWADGIYSNIRGDNPSLCALVIIGVNERGEKHFLAIEDGVRESKQRWKEVLLGLKERGMNPPKLARGDGAPGFWPALEEVYGETPQQRC